MPNWVGIHLPIFGTKKARVKSARTLSGVAALDHGDILKPSVPSGDVLEQPQGQDWSTEEFRIRMVRSFRNATENVITGAKAPLI